MVGLTCTNGTTKILTLFYLSIHRVLLDEEEREEELSLEEEDEPLELLVVPELLLDDEPEFTVELLLLPLRLFEVVVELLPVERDDEFEVVAELLLVERDDEPEVVLPEVVASLLVEVLRVEVVVLLELRLEEFPVVALLVLRLDVLLLPVVAFLSALFWLELRVDAVWLVGRELAYSLFIVSLSLVGRLLK